MRIATFNANSIRMRLGVILGWLEANRPDVFCVQETKVVDEQFPLRDIEAAGYHAVVESVQRARRRFAGEEPRIVFLAENQVGMVSRLLDLVEMV